MSGFVKLDTGVLNSSLWIERDLRSIFITALVMAKPIELKEATPQLAVRSLQGTGWTVPPGWYGFVEAAGTGIVRRDGMDDIEAGLDLLEKLSGPDPDSRSQRHDGRRMARIDGGYLILNYFEYRERDYTAADRMRKLRARRRKEQANVTPNNVEHVRVTANVTQAEAEADTEAENNNSPPRAREEKWPVVVENYLRALQNPSHWEAEFSMWLDGGRELPVTLADIEAAVSDYAANGERPNMMAFRAYLRRAFKARKAAEIGAVTEALKPETNGGGVFEKLLDLAELHPNGQFWRKERIEAEIGERAYEAFRAIGGNDRLRSLTTKDRPWVRKEFVEAYSR